MRSSSVARPAAGHQVDDDLGVRVDGEDGALGLEVVPAASRALTRLPLWATAIEPRGVLDGEGLGVLGLRPPAVE